jgi:hypothetical protein
VRVWTTLHVRPKIANTLKRPNTANAVRGDARYTKPRFVYGSPHLKLCASELMSEPWPITVTNVVVPGLILFRTHKERIHVNRSIALSIGTIGTGALRQDKHELLQGLRTTARTISVRVAPDIPMWSTWNLS